MSSPLLDHVGQWAWPPAPAEQSSVCMESMTLRDPFCRQLSVSHRFAQFWVSGAAWTMAWQCKPRGHLLDLPGHRLLIISMSTTNDITASAHITICSRHALNEQRSVIHNSQSSRHAHKIIRNKNMVVCSMLHCAVRHLQPFSSQLQGRHLQLLEHLCISRQSCKPAARRSLTTQVCTLLCVLPAQLPRPHPCCWPDSGLCHKASINPEPPYFVQ